MSTPKNTSRYALGFALLLAAPAAAQANSSFATTSASETGSEHRVEPATSWTEHVLGGSAVSPGQWPDTAGVFFSGELGCTGTLVAPQVVLTAGHCIDASIDKVLLNSTDASQGGEEIAVTQSIAYPNWETSYDVGILLLATPSSVPPRIIARGCAIDQFYAQGAAVEIVGYGATDPQGEQYGTRLLRGVTTITDASCSDPSCNGSVSPGGELIAGGNGVDSCFGDSGGPVYLQTADADYLIGVTSRGLESSPTPCGGGGIYTRADAVATWIEQESGTTLPMADCQSDGGGNSAEEPGEPGDETPGDGGEPGGDSDAPSGEESGDGAGPSTVTGGCSAGGDSPLGPAAFLLLLMSAAGLSRRRRA
jgi:uncharacterized protein (TIGR03382 family)